MRNQLVDSSKKQLRAYFLDQREKISLNEIKQLSLEMTEAFLAHFDLSAMQYLHVFLPIAQKKEVDTHFIIDALRQQYSHIQLVASRSNLTTREMDHFALDAHTPLVTNRWGIPEPVEGDRVPEQLLDIILVPLLGIDQRGYRIGYGKGFYDRFLSKCRNDVLKVGFSFFEPVEHIHDVEPTDVPMDYCIVKNRVLKMS